MGGEGFNFESTCPLHATPRPSRTSDGRGVYRGWGGLGWEAESEEPLSAKGTKKLVVPVPTLDTQHRVQICRKKGRYN